jgi:hypothetical protein
MRSNAKGAASDRRTIRGNQDTLNTFSSEWTDNEDDGLDVVGADLHFDEVVEAARDGGVDVVLTIYELERYMDAQDRREEAYNAV